MSDTKKSPQSSGSASGGGGAVGSGSSSGVNGTDATGHNAKESPSKEYHRESSSSSQRADRAHSSGKGAKRNRDKTSAAERAAAAAEREAREREGQQNRKMFIEDFWDCSICTFRNKAEAFKCGVCDARKGTSTRKPRINPAQLVVAQQVAQQPKPKRKREQSNKKLKNIDRNNDIQTSITVNGLTVVITEFKPKAPSSRKRTVSENSNGSSDGGGTIPPQSDDDFETLPSAAIQAEKSSP